mgnify:CR=1 FL=1
MDEDLKVNSESLRNDESQCSLDSLTGAIVDCAVRLHRAMGPGLLESIYEAVLARDLERRGFWVDRQKVLSFCYDGLIFND